MSLPRRFLLILVLVSGPLSVLAVDSYQACGVHLQLATEPARASLVRQALRWSVRLASAGLIDIGARVSGKAYPFVIELPIPPRGLPQWGAAREVGPSHRASWELLEEPEENLQRIRKVVRAGIYFALTGHFAYVEFPPSEVFELPQHATLATEIEGKAVTQAREFFATTKKSEALIADVDVLPGFPVKLYLQLSREQGRVRLEVWRAYDTPFQPLKDYISQHIVQDIPLLPPQEERRVQSHVSIPTMAAQEQSGVDYMAGLLGRFAQRIGLEVSEPLAAQMRTLIEQQMRTEIIETLYVSVIHQNAYWSGLYGRGFWQTLFEPAWFSHKILDRLRQAILNGPAPKNLADLRALILTEPAAGYSLVKRRMILGLIDRHFGPGQRWHYNVIPIRGFKVRLGGKYEIALHGGWMGEAEFDRNGQLIVHSNSLVPPKSQGLNPYGLNRSRLESYDEPALNLRWSITPLQDQNYTSQELGSLLEALQRAAVP